MVKEMIISGTNGRYVITENGIVFSIKNGKRSILKNRIKIKSSKTNGWRPYETVVIYYNGKPKVHYVHRLVAEHFLTNPSNKPQVNHIDNNPANNQVSNLEWVSPSENMRHSFATNKYRKNDNMGVFMKNNPLYGEKNPMAKLTWNHVAEIRRKYTPRVCSLRKLSQEYNVSKKLILLIIKNKIWKNETNVI